MIHVNPRPADILGMDELQASIRRQTARKHEDLARTRADFARTAPYSAARARVRREFLHLLWSIKLLRRMKVTL